MTVVDEPALGPEDDALGLLRRRLAGQARMVDHLDPHEAEEEHEKGGDPGQRERPSRPASRGVMERPRRSRARAARRPERAADAGALRGGPGGCLGRDGRHLPKGAPSRPAETPRADTAGPDRRPRGRRDWGCGTPASRGPRSRVPAKRLLHGQLGRQADAVLERAHLLLQPVLLHRERVRGGHLADAQERERGDDREPITSGSGRLARGRGWRRGRAAGRTQAGRLLPRRGGRSFVSEGGRMRHQGSPRRRAARSRALWRVGFEPPLRRRADGALFVIGPSPAPLGAAERGEPRIEGSAAGRTRASQSDPRASDRR